MKDFLIQIKHRCPNCIDGKIPNNPHEHITLFDTHYCSTCDSTGWIYKWITPTELLAELELLRSILAQSK